MEFVMSTRRRRNTKSLYSRISASIKSFFGLSSPNQTVTSTVRKPRVRRNNMIVNEASTPVPNTVDFRPKNFDQIVGQDTVKEYLKILHKENFKELMLKRNEKKKFKQDLKLLIKKCKLQIQILECNLQLKKLKNI